MRVWTVLLIAGLAAFAEDEESDLAKMQQKADPSLPGGIEIPDAGTKVEDSAVARQEVSRFKKEMKEAKNDATKMIELLTRLGDWDHPLVLAEAGRYVRHKHHNVAAAAIVACARQASSADKAGSMLYKCLSDKRTTVICAALVGMGKLGYDKSSVRRKAESYFTQDTDERHKAAARYFGYIQDKSAFRMLAEHLDEPTGPANPNDPTNPPASYWKKKWEDWARNVYYTRWAIAQLVPGETFETTAEAKMWAEQHGAEHGIEW